MELRRFQRPSGRLLVCLLLDIRDVKERSLDAKTFLVAGFDFSRFRGVEDVPRACSPAALLPKNPSAGHLKKITA